MFLLGYLGSKRQLQVDVFTPSELALVPSLCLRHAWAVFFNWEVQDLSGVCHAFGPVVGHDIDDGRVPDSGRHDVWCLYSGFSDCSAYTVLQYRWDSHLQWRTSDPDERVRCARQRHGLAEWDSAFLLEGQGLCFERCVVVVGDQGLCNFAFLREALEGNSVLLGQVQRHEGLLVTRDRCAEEGLLEHLAHEHYVCGCVWVVQRA